MVITAATSAYACTYHSSWNLTRTSYGNTTSDLSTAIAIAAYLAQLAGYGNAQSWMGVASTIAAVSTGGFWTRYYKRETFTSPDHYAYVLRTTFYKNANYTGQEGDPVCSPMYVITARVAEV